MHFSLNTALFLELPIAASLYATDIFYFVKYKLNELDLNLFDTIGLTADPFSTSPNVDLFYPAVEHRHKLRRA